MNPGSAIRFLPLLDDRIFLLMATFGKHATARWMVGITLPVLLMAACDQLSDVGNDPESESRKAVVAASLQDQRLDLGLQLLSGGQFKDSQLVFEAVLADHPNHPRPRFLRALSIQKQKNYAPALREFDAILLDPREFTGRDSLDHFRGWCLFYLGRPREAEVAFATHLADQPDTPDSQFGRGRSLLELGRPEPALAAFDKALELEIAGAGRRRSIGKTWIRRGDALWELDRFEEATKSFHKGVIQFADHYEGWAKLARGHERLQDEEKAAWARGEEQRARRRLGVPIDGDVMPDSSPDAE